MARLNQIEKTARDGTKVILRSPQPSDAQDILDSMRIVMRESQYLLTEYDEFNYTVEQEADMISSYLSNPNNLWIVPVVDNQIIGGLTFAAGSKRRISHQGSFGVSVLPEYCGKGIGQLMVEALLEWASAHPKIETVRLQVFARNEPAIKLYRRLGFEEEGREVRGNKFSDGTYDDTLLMAKHV